MGWLTTTDDAIAALASTKESKRLWALRTLQDKATDAGRKQRIGQHDVAVKQVVLMLSDPSPEIQATAAQTIVAVLGHPANIDSGNQERFGSEPGAVDRLVKNLGSSNTDVQLHAAKALWHLAQGHPGNRDRIGRAAGAVEGLVALLGSSTLMVQWAAGAALGVLAYMHMANSLTIASHPAALPGLSRLLGRSDQPAVQAAAAAVLCALCEECPVYAQQLVEQSPDTLQQLVDMAAAAAGPDNGQCAAWALLSMAASRAPGCQLLLKQPGVMAPLAASLQQDASDAFVVEQEDVRRTVKMLLVVVKEQAGMCKVVGRYTQLVAALQALATSSSDADTRDSAQKVLELVNTMGVDNLKSMQAQTAPPQGNQQPSSKPEATTSKQSASERQPPQQKTGSTSAYMAAASPLATVMGVAATALRAVPVHGALIGAVIGAAAALLHMVDQVRINKAKARALGSHVKGLLQYLEAMEPSWQQVQAAVSQQQWELLQGQLGALEAKLGQARNILQGYVRPMLLKRALEFLNGALDFEELCGVDAAISRAMSTLTTTTTSLNLVHTVKLGQQLAQQQEVALKQAHAEDVLQLQQDLSQLVGGQQALQQQLVEANSEQRQQWQEATALLCRLAAELGSIRKGVEQVQAGMERVEVGVEGLSSDMQAVMADVQELMALVKGSSASAPPAAAGGAAGQDGAVRDQRPVSSQLVLDREQVEWHAADKLDSGRFGSVYAGTYHGAPVAVKQLDMAGLDSEGKHQVFVEAAVLSRLHHPCIVQFFGVVVEQVLPSALSKKPQPRLSLVMERCDTNLDVLMHEHQPLRLPKALELASAIAAALTYLHHTSKVKVVHGDLKAGNVLLTENGRVKLTDFGLSQTIAINTSTLMHRGVVVAGGSPATSGGTLPWTAPEVIEAWATGNDRPAAPALDIYALGIILYHLLTGRAPYKQSTHPEALKVAVRAGKRPQWGDWQQEREGQAAAEVLVALQQLAEDCWSQEPGSRPTAQQVQKRLKKLQDQLG